VRGVKLKEKKKKNKNQKKTIQGTQARAQRRCTTHPFSWKTGGQKKKIRGEPEEGGASNRLDGGTLRKNPPAENPGGKEKNQREKGGGGAHGTDCR